MNELKLDEL